MKRLIITSLLATSAWAVCAQTFTDQARVRSAEPQYESVSVPRNECTSQWIEEPGRRDNYNRHGQQDRQYGGAILGGLAGGVVGHQFGGGAGKDAATALGVVLGAMTGDQMANRDERSYDDGRHESVQRQVQRCRTVYDAQTRITGYRVSYDYHGQSYTTFMHNNPGNSLPVRVTVDPIEQ
jgi:uncharacterized protein YcfJ